MGLAMVLVLAPVAGVALGTAIEGANACSDKVELTVAAAPEIAPVLKTHAKQQADKVTSEGICVDATVVPADSASMAVAMAEANGSEIDVGDAAVEKVEIPDVWVPESTVWLTRLTGNLNGALDERIDSVAEAPVGLAIKHGEADQETGVSLTSTDVATSDPRSDAASMAVYLASSTNKGVSLTSNPDGAKVMSQTALTQHNKNSDEKLMFVEPFPQLAPFEYPYVPYNTETADLQASTDAFRSSLLSNGFSNILASNGLRSPSPYLEFPDADSVDEALKAYKK